MREAFLVSCWYHVPEVCTADEVQHINKYESIQLQEKKKKRKKRERKKEKINSPDKDWTTRFTPDSDYT